MNRDGPAINNSHNRDRKSYFVSRGERRQKITYGNAIVSHFSSFRPIVQRKGLEGEKQGKKYSGRGTVDVQRSRQVIKKGVVFFSVDLFFANLFWGRVNTGNKKIDAHTSSYSDRVCDQNRVFGGCFCVLQSLAVRSVLLSPLSSFLILKRRPTKLTHILTRFVSLDFFLRFLFLSSNFLPFVKFVALLVFTLLLSKLASIKGVYVCARFYKYIFFFLLSAFLRHVGCTQFIIFYLVYSENLSLLRSEKTERKRGDL